MSPFIANRPYEENQITNLYQQQRYEQNNKSLTRSSVRDVEITAFDVYTVYANALNS